MTLTANHKPITAYALHQRGHRAIACWNWRPGSYLKLSDRLLTYSVHGRSSGRGAPTARDHICGVPPYQAYFDKPIWVAVRVEE
jgi:hypothetical protein